MRDATMAAVIAEEISDNDLIFVGVGTAGRAYTLAVGIPIVAARLAQLAHAPGADIYVGNLLNPDLENVPLELNQDSFTRWEGSYAPMDITYKVDALVRGDFDVSFESAAQVDRHGNLNITQIFNADRGAVRLVGSLAQPEHLAFVRKPIVVVDLSVRTFVEEVDFVSSFGHRYRGTDRKQLGYASAGPRLVVTDMCVFEFKKGHLALRSLHADVSLDDVLDRMAFRPVIPYGNIPVTRMPTEQQLSLISEEIDPNNVLLGSQEELENDVQG